MNVPMTKRWFYQPGSTCSLLRSIGVATSETPTTVFSLEWSGCTFVRVSIRGLPGFLSRMSCKTSGTVTFDVPGTDGWATKSAFTLGIGSNADITKNVTMATVR